MEYGQEEDVEKAVIAYALTRMAGAERSTIEVGDVLQNPMTVHYPLKKFDRIISAPQQGNKNINAQKLFGSDYRSEFLYSDSLSDSGAWIYTRHIIEKLTNDGKGVLVAPCSLLSREGNTRDDRIRITKRGSVEAVIQLPTWTTTANKRSNNRIRNCKIRRCKGFI